MLLALTGYETALVVVAASFIVFALVMALVIPRSRPEFPGKRLPIFLAELTGIHPTKEGIAAQLVLLGVYALGAIYVFAWRPARERRREAEAAA